MSLLEIASNPNLRLALISGIATSSYAFLSTLGASYFGIVPAIQHPDISEWTSATKIDLFKFYFDIAKVSGKPVQPVTTLISSTVPSCYTYQSHDNIFCDGRLPGLRQLTYQKALSVSSRVFFPCAPLHSDHDDSTQQRNHGHS